LRDDPAKTLLAWYDIHARKLPWRTPPGAESLSDPYHVWLSEIMLQQTTVAAVIPYFQAFTNRWPTIEALAVAEDADVMAAWAGLGYYARARNLLKCARLVADDLSGAFPGTEAELQKLPGIGPYTSAAVAAIGFDQKATVLDGNVERVMARRYNIHAPLPGSKETLRGLAAELTPDQRPGDYAQAVMDLGATICTPRNPACGICPWREGCKARIAGNAEDLPKKAPKQAKPVRCGVVFLARRVDGHVLLERRPDKGLLGGMLGLPGSVWAEVLQSVEPPLRADWREVPGEVRHTFTHFHLRLKVLISQCEDCAVDVPLVFAKPEPGDMPTVFKKALKHGLSAFKLAQPAQHKVVGMKS